MQGRPTLNQITNITQQIQDNYTDMFKLFEKTGLVQLHQSNELIRSSSPINSPIFNSVLQAHIPNSNVTKTINDVVEWAQKETSGILWATGPNTLPKDLPTQLKANHFQLADSPTGMAADISALPQKSFTDELSIKRVEDETSLQLWVDIVANVFGLPESTAKAFYQLYCKIGFAQDCPFVNYIGYSNNKPVSTASVYYNGITAGVYNVATIESARHHDFGTKITHHCLTRAANKGYNVSVLQGAADAVAIYENLGFKDYCIFEQFIYVPSSN